MRSFVALLVVIAMHLPGPARAQGSGSATLDTVRSRNAVACGISGTNPGFAFPHKTGETRGSEAEFCRAVAAAALGDASKVKWVILTATTRFTALQSSYGQVWDRTIAPLGVQRSLNRLWKQGGLQYSPPFR